MEQNLITAIEQMRNGSEEGFNTVYSNTYNRIYFRAKQLMKKEEDAQDLVQIVFVEAYRNINSLQSAETLYGWLDGITYNQGMKLFRKQRDVLLSEEAEDMFDALENNDVSAMPELTADQKETAVIIKGIIEELPELQRAAVVAYYYDGLKVERIADLMECSVGTIKSRLNYARKYIKERVEEKEKKEGYRLHVFGLPVLYFALRMLATETKLAAAAAQGIYNSACGAVGLKATMLGATGAAGDGATGAAATAAGSATGTATAAGAGNAAGAGVTTANAAIGAGVAGTAGMSATVKALIISGVVLLAGLGIGGGVYLATRDTGRDVVWEKYDDSDKKDKPERKPDNAADASEEETGIPKDLVSSFDEIDNLQYDSYELAEKGSTTEEAGILYKGVPISDKEEDAASEENIWGYWTIAGQELYFEGKVGYPLKLIDLQGNYIDKQMAVTLGVGSILKIYWDIPYEKDSAEWQKLLEEGEPSYYYYQEFSLKLEEYQIGEDFANLKTLVDTEEEFFYDFKILFPEKRFAHYNKDAANYCLFFPNGDLKAHAYYIEEKPKEPWELTDYKELLSVGDYTIFKQYDLGKRYIKGSDGKFLYVVIYEIHCQGEERYLEVELQLTLADLPENPNEDSTKEEQIWYNLLEKYYYTATEQFPQAFEATLLSNFQ